jgi:RNA polymerase sigma factor (sigma-70 family)
MSEMVLVIENLDLVARCSHLVVSGSVGCIDYNDFLQDGYEGLIKAANHYDSTKGDFRAFAASWVIGAMRETMRKTMRRWIHYDSLDNIFEDGTSFYEITPDETTLCPCEETVLSSEISRLNKTLQLIPPRLRFVLDQYYWKNKTLDEIAALLNISHSRACQLHNVALRGLKILMEEGNYEV